MRREALARWLNLSVIAAVVAVLTLVLVSGPTRVAYALDRCGSNDGTSPAPAEDTTFTISNLDPTSGQPAMVFDAVEMTAQFADYTDQFSVLDWRLIGNPESGDPRIIEADFVDNFESIGVFFMIPADAPPGSLTLSVCYALSDGSGGQVWYYSTNELIFTVEDYGYCDQDPEPSLNPFPTLFLFPEEGYAGDTFTAQASGGSFGGGDDSVAIENAIYLVVWWNWDGPSSDSGVSDVIYQGSHTPGQDVFLSELPVPNDALPGEYPVAICYLVETEGGHQWWYTAAPPDPPPEGPQGFVYYTVLEPLPDFGTCFEAPPSTSYSLAYDVAPPALHAGPAGSQDSAVLTALGTEPSLGTVEYYLLWDYGTADPFILGQFQADGQSSHTFAGFVVPYDAAQGLHTIGVCYLFDNDGTLEWRPAGSTIQFNVTGYANCGDQDPGGGETDVVVTLSPDTGTAGSGFTLSIDATGQGGGEGNYYFEFADLVQVIWDYAQGPAEFPPTGLVLTQVPKTDNSDTMTIPGLFVPTAAQPGLYPVNICYYIAEDLGGAGVGPALSNQGFWVAGTADIYNVIQESATSTPAPTSTPPVESTSTPPPDVEPEEPTATLTPTAIATSTPAPTSTPPIPPTIAVVGTSTAVVGGAEPTPPGGGTGTGPITPAGSGGGPLPNTGVQETTTPGSPTATPGTPTVAPTSTSSPTTPTPTPPPSPTRSPSDDVLGTRTEFVRSVGSFDELTDDFDVILTNVLLTGLFLILIFLTAEIFNQTIRDNQGDVENWMRNFFGPIIGIWGGLSAAMGAATLHNKKLQSLVWLGIVLVITVLIEGFLEPGFGFNKESVLLFLSLLVAVGLVTYLTEGGEAFVARGFGQDAAVRVFPAAIGIALICVIMSRLGGFIPGILYGFVGTAVFLRPSTLNQEQTGKMIFFPMAMMLTLSVGAWLLVDQFRGPDASDFDVFIEGILIGVFIATIESVAINMLPIAYMDGRKLIDWNPLVWFATAGVALFLLWTVLLNDEREYFDSLQETTSQVAIIAVVFTFGLSIVTWLWFRYRPGGHA